MEQSGEEGRELGEHEQVAVRDRLGHVGGDGVRHLGQMVVREPAAHQVHQLVVEARQEASRLLVVLLEELAGALGEYFAADGGAGGLRGPDGEGAPGGVLSGAAVA